MLLLQSCVFPAKVLDGHQNILVCHHKCHRPPVHSRTVPDIFISVLSYCAVVCPTKARAIHPNQPLDIISYNTVRIAEWSAPGKLCYVATTLGNPRNNGGSLALWWAWGGLQ